VILHREITLRYHLPSGNIVSGYRTCGWCYSCETNRDIERPFDVGEIIDKIQQLQQQKPRGLFTYIFGSGSKQRESNPEATKNLQDELYLARKRKSPPHCHIHAPLVTACLSCVRAGDRALVARFIVF
jgi:hypothetical protein